MLRSRQLDAILASGFSRESTEFHRDSRFSPKIVLRTRELGKIDGSSSRSMINSTLRRRCFTTFFHINENCNLNHSDVKL